ncbi:unnamed protein product [Adineta ricciae]|uniref:Uncharacterized protein n=1 Tax=Adineta ricciae TaxID=249248 RepID=A0A815B5D2_ADIRI|nr:unnamed protein product [Adineta ricciae]
METEILSFLAWRLVILEFRCYRSLAAVEVELKNYDEAIKLYEQQLDILQKMPDIDNQLEEITSCYISIGKVYWLKSKYDQAIAYQHRALEHIQSYLTSPTQISAVYKNLANIFTNTKEFRIALEYFEKALSIDDECHPKNYLQIGQTYANMGMMYQSKQNYRKALDCFEKARENLLQMLPSTHVAVEKINKTICKIMSNSNGLTILPETDSRTEIEQLVNARPANSEDILTRNNIMVLWLDDHIGRDENCRALKAEFRQITTSLKMVDSVRSCRECLPYVKNRKLFCIIQGKYAKEIVPDIVQIVSSSIKPVVYIFCLHMISLVEWAQEQECILEGGMFDHEKNLFNKLRNDLNDYANQKSKESQDKWSAVITNFLIKFTRLSTDCYETNTIVSSQETVNDRRQDTSTVA